MFHIANSLTRAEMIFLWEKQQIALYMEVGVKYIPSLKARADFSLGFGGSRIEVASHSNVLRGSSRVPTPRTEGNDCVTNP